MIRISFKLLVAASILALAGCTGKHLINNKAYLAKVETDFKERQTLAVNRKTELFSVFDKSLSDEKKEALKFLFAYSPLNDLADLSGDFFLANTEAALDARKATPWGKTIPEDIFLHWVLPFRVNNENADLFRVTYYSEIMARIKGMDARQAAIEINHWCHEKVSYQPADIRTSGPISTILSARGRCGEESTFTVAALRTAGLPARQVYTPRWAHSDDNHAWVEVWLNGEWFYMGACEPEAVLDRGWFTEPARRTMLIHSKSFGAYSGNEDTVVTGRNYSEINNLAKYSVTKRIYVKVMDSENKPVNAASVEYQLYNYAEFYPLAVVPTDKNGLSSFITGLGDLLIWARKGDNFNFRKISVAENDTIKINIDQKPFETGLINFDLGVPVVRTPFPSPDTELLKENSKRVDNENSIRQKYIDSWMKPSQERELAIRCHADTQDVRDLITRSMGNYGSLVSFLSSIPDTSAFMAINLLKAVADKDLRDTPAEVFSDHLKNTTSSKYLIKEVKADIYNEYILNPRIANELLVSWRGYFLRTFSESFKNNVRKDPGVLVKFIKDNIKIADSENHYKTPLTPVGVDRLKVSDSFSRDIYFVAVCRSLCIAARLEPGSNIPQFYSENGWKDVKFTDSASGTSGKGYLKLKSNDINPVPEYYIHFTLAKFDNGRYNTLEYDYNKKITEFKDELKLEAGYYMLVTGNRINDSKILSSVSFFYLNANEHKILEVKIRKDPTPAEIIGKLNPASEILMEKSQKLSLDKIISKGLVIIWMEPDKEPTRHIFNDLPLLKKELDGWGGAFLFLTLQPEMSRSFDLKSIKGLPANSIAGIDPGSDLLKSVSASSNVSDIRLPYIILADKNGNICFRSEGYRIGIGEQILRKARQ